MHESLTAEQRRQVEELLDELGRCHQATIQLVERIGKRWSYVAGATSPAAGQVAGVRLPLSASHGAIVFPEAAPLSPSAEAAIVAALGQWLRGEVGDQ